VAELVAMNETSEYLAIFPEDTAVFEPVIAKYNNLKQQVFDLVDKYMQLESQKDFALAVKDYPTSGILFHARKTGVIHFDEKLMVKLLCTQ
jgi:hypothetical protein